MLRCYFIQLILLIGLFKYILGQHCLVFYLLFWGKNLWRPVLDDGKYSKLGMFLKTLVNFIKMTLRCFILQNLLVPLFNYLSSQCWILLIYYSLIYEKTVLHRYFNEIYLLAWLNFSHVLSISCLVCCLVRFICMEFYSSLFCSAFHFDFHNQSLS